MLVSTPLVPDAAPLGRPVRGNGRIVWQQHYEGISHVAYRGGKAIAGVSGPWSDRYALIWWDERPAGSDPLELFYTIETAKRAVEERVGLAMPDAVVPSESRPNPRRGWWAGIWPQRRNFRTATLRRRYSDAEIDLSGLNFGALR